MANDLKQRALEYHRLPTPGKLQIVATKPLGSQHDLSLAYSPGVGAACEAIVRRCTAGQAGRTTTANVRSLVTDLPTSRTCTWAVPKPSAAVSGMARLAMRVFFPHRCGR